MPTKLMPVSFMTNAEINEKLYSSRETPTKLVISKECERLREQLGGLWCVEINGIPGRESQLFFCPSMENAAGVRHLLLPHAQKEEVPAATVTDEGTKETRLEELEREARRDGPTFYYRNMKRIARSLIDADESKNS